MDDLLDHERHLLPWSTLVVRPLGRHLPGHDEGAQEVGVLLVQRSRRRCRETTTEQRTTPRYRSRGRRARTCSTGWTMVKGTRDGLRHTEPPCPLLVYGSHREHWGMGLGQQAPEGLVRLSETREVQDHEARANTLREDESGVPDRGDGDDPVALLLELCQKESPQPSIAGDQEQISSERSLYRSRIGEPAPRAVPFFLERLEDGGGPDASARGGRFGR